MTAPETRDGIRWLRERADSYWRDAVALEANGDEAMSAAYRAVADELWACAALEPPAEEAAEWSYRLVAGLPTRARHRLVEKLALGFDDTLIRNKRPDDVTPGDERLPGRCSTPSRTPMLGDIELPQGYTLAEVERLAKVAAGWVNVNPAATTRSGSTTRCGPRPCDGTPGFTGAVSHDEEGALWCASHSDLDVVARIAEVRLARALRIFRTEGPSRREAQ